MRNWIACAVVSPLTLPMTCSICIRWNVAWAAGCRARTPRRIIRPQANLVFMIGFSFFREILLRGQAPRRIDSIRSAGPPLVNRIRRAQLSEKVTKLLLRSACGEDARGRSLALNQKRDPYASYQLETNSG